MDSLIGYIGGRFHPPLLFTWVKKCEIWRRLEYHSNLSRQRLKMQQDPNSETKDKICSAAMIALCPGQGLRSWVYAFLRKLCQFYPTP